MTNAPERIRVARDADGFWTCREAVSGSQEYIRDDLYYAANNRARASEAEAISLRRKLEEAQRDIADYKAGYQEAAQSDMANAARAEVAERKLEEHRKALEPFATAAGHLTDANGWCNTDGIELCYDDGRRLSVIPLSAFREAARVLSEREGQE